MSVERTEIEIRMWPLRIHVRGTRAIGALKGPLAFLLIMVGAAMASAIVIAAIVYCSAM